MSDDLCLFVLGCDRSGTTLLQGLLNSHPDIFISYEIGIIYPLKNVYEREGASFMIDLVCKRGLIEEGQALQVLDEYRDGKFESFSNLLAKLYRMRASKDGKSIWGDKMPSYTGHIDELAFLFPNSRFINIIRDPRGVSSSWAKTDWGPMTTYHAAKKWRKKIYEARESLIKLDKNRYENILFEDLVNDPEPVLRRICRLVGKEYDSVMLDPINRKKSILPKRLDELHPDRNKPVNSNIAEKWRELPKNRLSHIETICREDMLAFGYKPITVARKSVPIFWKVYYLLENKILRYKRKRRK